MILRLNDFKSAGVFPRGLYRWLKRVATEAPHCTSGINHTIREAPFIVVPTQDPNELAIDDLGFRQVEDGTVRVMVEI